MAFKSPFFRYVVNPTRPAPRESFGGLPSSRKIPEPNSLYQPIPPTSREIRLLILHSSSSPRSIIKCTLVRACLDFIPAAGFGALYYEWGEPEAEEIIIINNIPKTKDRTVWIDAICINQENISERNHQVRQMAQIYSIAQRVLIWLGAEDDDSRAAIRFISQVGRLRSEDSSYKLGTSSYRPFQMHAVQNLIKQPYWKRLWIIQKIIVARNAMILCGMDSVSWSDFSKFQAAFESRPHGSAIGRVYNNLSSTVAFGLNRQRAIFEYRNPTLRNLLEDFAYSDCSDVRDKIFGLAGLASDAHHLVIDYSITAFDLFEDVTMLQKYEDSGSLVAFAQRHQIILKGHVQDSAGQSFRPQPQSFRALGYDCGSVHSIGYYFEDLNSHAKFQQAIQSIWGNASSIRTLIYSSQIGNMLDADFRFYIRQSVIPISSLKSYGVPGDVISSEYQQGLRTSVVEDVDSLQQLCKLLKLQHYDSHVYSKTKAESGIDHARLRIFFDTGGDIGIGPNNVRLSDTVCRFRGCDIVAILRKTGNQYHFIGRALFPSRFLRMSGRTGHSERNWSNFEPISIFIDTYTLQSLTQ